MIGKLQVISPSSAVSNIAASVSGANHSALSQITARIDDAVTGPQHINDEQDLNLHGNHVGDLTEDAIALTCWIIVEAEHRLRYKILDVLEEIGENFEG